MLPWNHNAYYHQGILRRIPRRAGHVLDVGCGVGHLACDLAKRVDHGDAIDLDAAMITATRALVPLNVSCSQVNITEDALPPVH